MTNGSKVDKLLVDTLKKNKPLSTLTHIGRVNGRIDLRGVLFPKPEGVDVIYSYEALSKPFIIKNYHFENVDFSSADLSYVVFEKCVFTNCLFEKTNLSSARLEAMKIIDCHFIKADFRDSFIGIHIGKNSGEIQQTIFSKTNFTNAIFYFPIINETLFDDCKINEVNFDSSRFSNCKFKGVIRDSWFRGYSMHWEPGLRLFSINYKNFQNPMMNVDFTECKLDGVMFSHGIDLSHCKFPDDEDIIVVKDLAKVYGKARQIIADTWSGNEREVYLRMIDFARYDESHKEQQIDVVQYEHDHPEDRKFFDLIKQINDTV